MVAVKSLDVEESKVRNGLYCRVCLFRDRVDTECYLAMTALMGLETRNHRGARERSEERRCRERVF